MSPQGSVNQALTSLIYTSLSSCTSTLPPTLHLFPSALLWVRPSWLGLQNLFISCQWSRLAFLYVKKKKKKEVNLEKPPQYRASVVFTDCCWSLETKITFPITSIKTNTRCTHRRYVRPMLFTLVHFSNCVSALFDRCMLHFSSIYQGRGEKLHV